MAGWVALSVLARSILDFFGIAALIPVLIMVLGKDSNPTKALQLCVAVFVFVLLKNALVMRLARFQNHFYWIYTNYLVDKCSVIIITEDFYS